MQGLGHISTGLEIELNTAGAHTGPVVVCRSALNVQNSFLDPQIKLGHNYEPLEKRGAPMRRMVSFREQLIKAEQHLNMSENKTCH